MLKGLFKLILFVLIFGTLAVGGWYLYLDNTNASQKVELTKKFKICKRNKISKSYSVEISYTHKRNEKRSVIEKLKKDAESEAAKLIQEKVKLDRICAVVAPSKLERSHEMLKDKDLTELTSSYDRINADYFSHINSVYEKIKECEEFVSFGSSLKSELLKTRTILVKTKKKKFIPYSVYRKLDNHIGKIKQEINALSTKLEGKRIKTKGSAIAIRKKRLKCKLFTEWLASEYKDSDHWASYLN